MKSPLNIDRRGFLQSASAATAAASFSIVAPSALGREQVSAGEKITLGVVGIGPRCTYDMKSILQLNDVQCVAIADVQRSRRDAGKKLVDEGGAVWFDVRTSGSNRKYGSARRPLA